MFIKRHHYKNEEVFHSPERKYVQNTYLTKNGYPRYMKNYYYLIIKRQIQYNMGNGLKRHFTEGDTQMANKNTLKKVLYTTNH